MIHVQAPSRLHFGLFTLGPAQSWPNIDGRGNLPGRQFGGVGLMVEHPGVCVQVGPAPKWSSHGPLAERALAFARKLAEFVPGATVRPQAITVEHAAPEHVGLGTGTQLALAVARALAAAWGHDGRDSGILAKQVGRGLRSAVGIHGFGHGGFLVEAGKRKSDELSPLVARAHFPESWPIVIAIPPWSKGVHGVDEENALRRLDHLPLTATEALCRVVLLGVLPALAERDWQTFGEALYDFNARVGDAFSLVQGGRYAHPLGGELVAFIRKFGVPGTGQSSWGPAIFAIARDTEQAADLVGAIRKRFDLQATEILCTVANNRGPVVEIQSHRD